MEISQLYIYPIKSLRPTAISHARINRHGILYDRRFMLLKVNPDGTLGTLQVGHYLPMALFSTNVIFPEDEGGEEGSGGGKIIVTYRAPVGQQPDKETTRTLEVPLQPSTAGLETVQVTMYRSGVTGYKMPAEYGAWFSDCFGFDVVLAYVGENRRPVLGNLPPQQQPGPDDGGWLSSIASMIPYFGGGYGDGGRNGEANDSKMLAFSDVAPYLVVSETSLDNVSSRLPEGEEMDVTKFRPNIVLSGAETAFEEDFWAELAVSNKRRAAAADLRFVLTSNCARCQSINVDFDTGEAGAGESGSVLKKLMKDRRVDKGKKYSPVFGRYGFLGANSGGSDDCELSVGDKVVVARRNEQHTTFGETPFPVPTTCVRSWWYDD